MYCVRHRQLLTTEAVARIANGDLGSTEETASYDWSLISYTLFSACLFRNISAICGGLGLDGVRFDKEEIYLLDLNELKVSVPLPGRA